MGVGGARCCSAEKGQLKSCKKEWSGLGTSLGSQSQLVGNHVPGRGGHRTVPLCLCRKAGATGWEPRRDASPPSGWLSRAGCCTIRQPPAGSEPRFPTARWLPSLEGGSQSTKGQTERALPPWGSLDPPQFSAMDLCNVSLLLKRKQASERQKP